MFWKKYRQYYILTFLNGGQREWHGGFFQKRQARNCLNLKFWNNNANIVIIRFIKCSGHFKLHNLCKCQNSVFFNVKTLSEPSCKVCNARFTTVPLKALSDLQRYPWKLCLIYNGTLESFVWSIIFNNFENCLFSINNHFKPR